MSVAAMFFFSNVFFVASRYFLFQQYRLTNRQSQSLRQPGRTFPIKVT
jgi:hypothetical protein